MHGNLQLEALVEAVKEFVDQRLAEIKAQVDKITVIDENDLIRGAQEKMEQSIITLREEYHRLSMEAAQRHIADIQLYADRLRDITEAAQRVKGEKGDPGERGLQGERGLPGEKGEKGDPGERGPTGFRGEQGEPGPEGDRGPQGIQGERGMPGPPGQKGDPGDIGPIGPEGRQGERGERGPQGEKGLQGDRGPQGLQGEKGEKGEPGERGLRGEKGDPGERGLPGEPGQKGDPGERGLKGDKGDRGDPGERGPAGLSGGLKTWRRGVVWAGASVAYLHRGGTFIAEVDPEDSEPSTDARWRCVADGIFTETVKSTDDPRVRQRVTEYASGKVQVEDIFQNAVVWRGTWEEETSYLPGDMTAKNGGSWIATRETRGEAPGDSDAWNLLAKQGRPGKTGDVGPRGEKGDRGPAGPRGNSIESVTLTDDGTDIIFEFTSGELVKVPLPMVAQKAAPQDDDYPPVKRYRGLWEANETYERGDIVKFMNTLWLCAARVKGGLPGKLNEKVWLTLLGIPNAGPGGDPIQLTGLYVVVADAAARGILPVQDGLMVYETATDTHWLNENGAWKQLTFGGGARVVADQAARLALSAQVKGGDIVVQRDDRSTWVWDTGALGGAAWQEISTTVRQAANIAARLGMAGRLKAGDLVVQEDDHSLWLFRGGAMPWEQVGGAGGLQKVGTLAALTALPVASLAQGDVYIVQANSGVYVYAPANPAAPTNTLNDWHPVGTSEVLRVRDLAALNVLPDADLPPGRTVIVNNIDGQGTFALVVRNFARRTNSLTDFDVILPDPAAHPVVIVDTPADLPAQGVEDTVYVVRQDANGIPLNRRLVWDPALAVHVPQPTGYVLDVPVNQFGDDWIVELTTTGDVPLADDVDFALRVTTTGGANPGTVTLPARGNQGQDVDVVGGLFQNIAAGAIGTSIGITGAYDPATNMLTLSPLPGGATIVNVAPTFTGPGTRPPPVVQPTGDWRNLDTQTVLQPTRANALPLISRQAGDIATTIEADHSRISVHDGTNWLTLFDEDEIKEWIAAGSLFRGTVADVAHAGAIALSSLPTPDAANRGNYWTWSGPSNWEVQGGLTNPAAHEVTVHNNTPSATPGQTGSFGIVVDGAGAAGTDRTLTFEVRLTVGGHNVVAPLSVAILAADDAAAIAGKIIAAWNALAPAQQFGATLAINGADPTQIDVTPGTTDEFRRGWLFPDGATPGIGVDLAGELLNPGDWIQSNGQQFVHVASDLLSKTRGDHLYGLQPWQDGSWERGSLAYFDEGIYRAARPVVPGDIPPSTPTGPVTIVANPARPVGFVPDIAGLNVIIAQMPVTPANMGRVSVLTAGATGGTTSNGLTVQPHEGIMNTGNPAIGAGGWVVVTGLTFHPPLPAETVNPAPGGGTAITTAAGAVAVPLPDPANVGQWFHVDAPIRVPVTQTGVGAAFGGQTIPAGSTIMILRHTAQGTAGYSLVQGPGAPQPPAALPIGQTPVPPTVPDYVYTPPVGASPWQKLELRGTFISIPDDLSLPANAAGDHLYFVQTSVRNDGRPALYRWNANLSEWQNVADSPHPMALYATEADLQAANPGAHDVLGFALTESTLWRWNAVQRGWGQLPLLTKPRADRLYVADWHAGETWEAGAVVVYKGRLYRASRAITATDPVPHPAVIPVRGLNIGANPDEEWTALDAIIDQLPGNYNAGDWVRFTAPYQWYVNGQMMPEWVAWDQRSFSAGDALVVTGVPVNGRTTDGQDVLNGIVHYLESFLGGAAPPAAINIIPSTPWVPLSLDGGVLVVEDPAHLPQDSLASTIAVTLNRPPGGGGLPVPKLHLWDEVNLQWRELGGSAAGGISTWAAATAYKIAEVVVHDGRLWSALRATTAGEEPGVVRAAWAPLEHKVHTSNTTGDRPDAATPRLIGGAAGAASEFRPYQAAPGGAGEVGIAAGIIGFWPGSHNNTNNPTAVLTALGPKAFIRLTDVLGAGNGQIVVETNGVFTADAANHGIVSAPVAEVVGTTTYGNDWHTVEIMDPLPGALGDEYVNTADKRSWVHDGTIWVERKSSAPGLYLVPNEAARLALNNLNDGSLVVQQDTGWTWRYQASYVGHAFWSPWRVFSDYVGAADAAARDALAPHIHIGTLVSIGAQMWQYVANPNTAAGQPPGIFVPFGDHTHTDFPATEVQKHWLNRGLSLLGVTAANDAEVSNALTSHAWDVLITGQARADTDLFLLMHTAHMNSTNTDAPITQRTGKDAIGPWKVKAQAPFAIRISGHAVSYGIWLVEFNGTGIGGKRVFDTQAVIHSENAPKLPAFGVEAVTGNVYINRARFVMKREV